MDITADIETVSVEQSRRFSKTSEEAWTGVECPYCRASMLFVIARRGTVEDIAYGDIKNAWLYCVNCRNGCVVNESKLVPGKMTFPTPEGTPQLEAQLWEEIRRCLSVSAFNAVAMLCRKLLLHMVLTHKRSIDPEAPPEDLNFAAAVRYLGENGVITAAMNNLAVNIKDVGNKANHELPHITQTEANDIALFTHYLFISV